MTLSLIITVGAGALVAGLAGFGTGLVARGFWLHVIDPLVAAPLVVIRSVVAQAHTLPAVRQGIRWPRLWPFLIGGRLAAGAVGFGDGVLGAAAGLSGPAADDLERP